MITLNAQKVTFGHFPDGSMLIKQLPGEGKSASLSWFYESDRELVGLIYLVNHLKSHGITDIRLFMPYIPNARQDRVKSEEDVFTLKYFAGVLNSLALTSVTVLDPHSSVSEALIDRVRVESPKAQILSVIEKIQTVEGAIPSMFYPDEGAGKRYGGMIPLPYAFGIKKRDWKTGQIQGLDAAGDVQNIAGKNILIVDDICSRGGTFFHSAKKLKELGARHVYLYITHCENTILEGDLLTCGLINQVYTTDSIFTGQHQLVEVLPLERR